MRGSATTMTAQMTAMRANMPGAGQSTLASRPVQWGAPSDQQRNQESFSLGQKLVIALCRRPLGDEESLVDENNKKEDVGEESQDYIEYTKNSMSQIYHVEEVISLVDIANDGSRDSQPAMDMSM